MLAAFALLLLLLAWRESKGLIAPQWYSQPNPEGFSFSETPRSTFGIDFEDVSFSAPTGEVLRGWLVPAATPSDLVFVTLHGRAGDRRSHLKNLQMLRSTGAAVLLFDLRENGLSDGDSRGTGLAVREAEDAVAAAQEMRRRGYSQIVVFGCSLGGSAAVIAAAKEPSISGVIAEASIARFEDFVADGLSSRLKKRGVHAGWIARLWGRLVVSLARSRAGISEYIAPEDVISEISPRPILIVHGSQDPTVSTSHAASLISMAGPSAEMWLIEGSAHCDGPQVAQEEYHRRVADFVGRLSSATTDVRR
ncbi:alpha/beta fold hydrolase [Hyphomonas sp. WL0036]|uniref:alpha/beta hydrolase n=1 Tax=Hyphomonas sediminis TaxID=2866160 RepID=UPI001C7E9739|nr:alpha/beta fold hydrolase [Hyphomonas sediminis]MBY9067961.1 alpha/beta fold hydrolase [Hyphomonas sediminis]